MGREIEGLGRDGKGETARLYEPQMRAARRMELVCQRVATRERRRRAVVSAPGVVGTAGRGGIVPQ